MTIRARPRVAISFLSGGLVTAGSIICAFVTADNQTVADLISKTVVVDE